MPGRTRAGCRGAGAGARAAGPGDGGAQNAERSSGTSPAPRAPVPRKIPGGVPAGIEEYDVIDTSRRSVGALAGRGARGRPPSAEGQRAGRLTEGPVEQLVEVVEVDVAPDGVVLLLLVPVGDPGHVHLHPLRAGHPGAEGREAAEKGDEGEQRPGWGGAGPPHRGSGVPGGAGAQVEQGRVEGRAGHCLAAAGGGTDEERARGTLLGRRVPLRRAIHSGQLSGAACGEPPVAPSGRNSTAGRYSTPVARTRPPIEPVPPLDPPVAEKGGRVVNQGDHPRPAARRVIMALRCCASSPLSVPTTRHAVASTPLRGESSPVPRSTPSRASPGFPPGHCGPVGGDAGGPCGPPSGGGTERRILWPR